MSETVTNNRGTTFAGEKGMKTWHQALCTPLP